MTIHFIPIQSVKIAANRQRQEFDPIALGELRDSIQNIGLLHPIVLRRELGDFYLVAGERRLRAIQDLHDLGLTFRHGSVLVPGGSVPYTDVGELPALARLEAEYEENARRVDLTWQENARATTSLLQLRTAQAEASNLPPPTIADISREVRGSAVGDYHTKTRQEVIVAKHLSDPDVQKAANLKDAFKILQKKEQGARNVSIAQAVGPKVLASSHTLQLGDSEDLAALLPAGTFDCICTDPPYGMGADTFGDAGQGTAMGAHFYDDSYEHWQGIMDWFCPAITRLAKPDAHAYVFCDLDRFAELRDRMGVAGWKVHRTPIIWHKPGNFRSPWPEHGPQRKYETILYAIRGDRKVTRIAPDLVTCGTDANLGHPAQKPVELLRDLISRSCGAGERVLDLFAGTGGVLEAAHLCKCSATAFEQDPQSYGIAVTRLETIQRAAEAQKDLL